MKIRNIHIEERFSENEVDKLLDECTHWLKASNEYGNELLNTNAENIFAAMLSDTHYQNRVLEVKKHLQAASQLLIELLWDIEDNDY